VATKADQVKPSRVAEQRRAVAHALGLRPEALAWVSSDRGVGINALRDEMIALLSVESAGPAPAPAVVRPFDPDETESPRVW